MNGVVYRTLLKKFEDSNDPQYFDAGDIREEFGLPCSDNGVGPKGKSAGIVVFCVLVGAFIG